MTDVMNTTAAAAVTDKPTELAVSKNDAQMGDKTPENSPDKAAVCALCPFPPRASALCGSSPPAVADARAVLSVQAGDR